MSKCFDQRYALLVGVNKNLVSDLALPGVGRDAIYLARVLRDQRRCGYLAHNIKVITGRSATRTGIMEGLKWLSARIQSDEHHNATAIVYFSGHGWQNTGAQESSYYLLPYDFQEGATSETAIPAAEFANAVSALAARRLLMVLDCCHAGGVAVKIERDSTMAYAPAAFPVEVLVGTHKADERPSEMAGSTTESVIDLDEGAGRAVLSSSLAEEPSFIRDDGKMSVFTYHLFEALTGHAQPGVGAREVLVSDIIGYVARKVPETTGGKQHPTTHLDGQSFAVALLLGGREWKATEPLWDPITYLNPIRSPGLTMPRDVDFRRLLQRLHDQSWQGRRDAAISLGQSADARAIGPLIDHLYDEEREVQQAVAEALGHLAGPTPGTVTQTAIIEALAGVLGYHDDAAVRASAAEALGDTGLPEAVEPLKRSWQDEDSDVRREVMAGLGKLGARGRQALMDAVKDDKLAPLAYGALLQCPDRVAREQVAAELMERLGRGEGIASKPLAIALQDREHEAWTLLKTQLQTSGETFVDSLVLLLESADEDERDHVAGLLAEIARPSLIEALLPLLQSGSRWVKTTIAKMIELISTENLSLAIKYRANPYSLLRTKGEDWHVRLAVVNALGKILEREAAQYGNAHLPQAIIAIAIDANENWHVRLAAIRVLGKTRSHQAVSILEGILTRTKGDGKPQDAGADVEAPGKPSHDMGRRSLRRSQDDASEADREPQLRIAAVEALGEVGCAEAKPSGESAKTVLKRLMDDGDPLARTAAKQMLDKIQEIESEIASRK